MQPLEALLDDVRTAVRAANFSTLAQLAPQLEAALADLSEVSAKNDPATIGRIKAKAEQNAPLLDAARRGISAARRRLEEVRRASKGLQTYDMRGHRAEIAPIGPTAGRF
ncbi:MAG: hypothetical protein K9G43_01235 [Rhodobacteraceae bacterium]|nr:hypothetical protein [Paracoccaceae bacterium]